MAYPVSPRVMLLTGRKQAETRLGVTSLAASNPLPLSLASVGGGCSSSAYAPVCASS